jgi:hypothetical protein
MKKYAGIAKASKEEEMMNQMRLFDTITNALDVADVLAY